jgi:cation:H+ antiporter
MTVVYLLLALGVILLSAELFTNAVEWFGRRYELGEGAVGSVLAAVGTALPETLVPIIAIVILGGQAEEDIGVGAILGAPFMLSSLAMFVTATAIFVFAWTGRRTREVTLNEPVMRRDLSYFLIAYGVAIVSGLVNVHHVKWILAPLLTLGYAFYVYRTLKEEGDLGGETKPLYFHRHPVMPHRRRIFAQLFVALVGIIGGAYVFVEAVREVSVALGASPLIVSLLITPVATELPEKFNSVIWIRQKKDTLALGNITGAMVFQSTFPVSVGLLFTTWELPRDAYVSGALTLFAGLVYYLTLRIKHTMTWWSIGGGSTVYFAYLAYVLIVYR